PPMSLSDRDLELAKKHGSVDYAYDDEIIFTHAMFAAFLAERDQLAIKEKDDAVRELKVKIQELPRYSFLSPKEGGVRRFGDKSGAWIERYEVITILDN